MLIETANFIFEEYLDMRSAYAFLHSSLLETNLCTCSRRMHLGGNFKLFARDDFKALFAVMSLSTRYFFVY